MAVASLCYLCPRPALSNCHNCGRPACLLHLDASHTLCESCRTGRRMGGGIRRA